MGPPIVGAAALVAVWWLTTIVFSSDPIIAAMAPQHALPAVVETFQLGGFTRVSAWTDPKIYITMARQFALRKLALSPGVRLVFDRAPHRSAQASTDCPEGSRTAGHP